MGVTAENLATRGSISRERQDEFAVRSHRLAAEARETGVGDERRRRRRLLMSAERAAELAAPVRARILAYASCGVEPAIMGIGPVPAVHKVLERSGRDLNDVQVIELNEAFAAQALAVIDDLGLDVEKVNPNGGAIAMGHPIGATGAAITAKILDEMERRDLELGLVTLCIGGGQGIAMLLGRE